MKPLRKVAVLIESSRETGRRMIEGVARYSQEQTSWSIYFEPRALDTKVPKWLRQWEGDGILARLDSRRMIETVLSVGVPVVDLRGFFPDERLALLVIGNNVRIVELAFEHLHDQGLRNFAFCGSPTKANRFLDERRDILRDLVHKSGLPFADFPIKNAGRQPKDWDKDADATAAWLRSLVKPVGVVACNDDRGYHVLEACRRAELRVPDEVAVIGVDNDSVMCNMSVSRMSSIDQDAMRIGFEAAAWLDRIMSGEKPPSHPIIVEPKGVIPRNSTDVLAIDDPKTITAIRYIRQNACAGVRVQDVLRNVPISQTELERRFKQHLGRTPKAEILRVQIAHARRLLSETELQLSDVARQSGFSSEKYFSDVFFRMTNVRPAKYRREILLKAIGLPPAGTPNE